MTELKMRAGRVSALLAVLLVAFATFGCDSSPTSPSTSPSPSSSSSSQETTEGAELSGTFTSASASSSRFAAFSKTDVNDITVEVLGTGQSAAVTNGTFFLPELPTGSFTLVFRDGTGTELARLTFNNVLAGQKIELLLEFHDQGVVLLKEVRDGGTVVDNTTVDDEGNNAGDNGNGAGNAGGGESPSFEGSLSGGWNGSCDDIDVSGRFSISVSANGNVSGSYSGDDSGSINGSVRNNGSFSAAAGSAGECRWSGDINGSGSSLSGSGTWTCPDDCSGNWSGP